MTAVLPALTLVPAGAGSGKTYRIKEQLADWVVSGAVQPDRIAAVTFTETAAGELRDRIRSTLMARGRMEDALRLDQSFITTIHGFGNRLLVEYAFEAKHSPAPRLLGEDEESLLLRKAIARIERIETISRKLELFGYTYDFVRGTDGAAQFRDRILSCVQMLRVIGGGLNRPLRLAHALGIIEQAYGPTEDARGLTDPLRRSTQRLLEEYPDCMRDFVKSDSAKSAVELDHRMLQEAANTSALDDNWGLWQKLQKLKVFKADTQLPAGYQQLARQIIAQAGELYRHPGPLADALTHARVLLEYISRVEMCVHFGTHIDAPLHFVKDGSKVEDVPLDTLIGRAQVCEIPQECDLITADVLKEVEIEDGVLRLLFKTRNSQHWLNGDMAFDKDFVALSVDAAQYLIEKGVLLVGIDYLSIASFYEPVPTHVAFLENGVVLAENLDLSAVPAGLYELICLPLNISGAEGSPARVVLVEDFEP